ncbi:nop10 ribonucleoprotein isoform X1 [Colletes latitarsis]|uniref:nop10 ribonucleoprotein isoform X1 n=1 Tax=Colletes latitarsis TaxID=2605962 RepID=UPI0040356D13
MDPPRLERSSEFFSVASGKGSMNYNCHVLITKRRVQSKLFIACTAADCMRLVVHARFNVNVSVSVHDYFLWIERLQIIDTLYSDYLPVRCADHACLNADFAKKNCQNFYTHGPVAYICEQSVLSSTRYSDLNKSIWASTYHCATYACVTKVHTFNSSTTRCNRCKQNRSKWKTHIVSTSSSIFSRR